MASRTDKTTDLYKQEEKNAKKKSFRPTLAILFLLGFNIIWITEKYCIGKYALNLRKGASELVFDPTSKIADKFTAIARNDIINEVAVVNEPFAAKKRRAGKDGTIKVKAESMPISKEKEQDHTKKKNNEMRKRKTNEGTVDCSHVLITSTGGGRVISIHKDNGDDSQKSIKDESKSPERR